MGDGAGCDVMQSECDVQFFLNRERMRSFRPSAGLIDKQWHFLGVPSATNLLDLIGHITAVEGH
jgi:hypothetical protein